MALCVYAAKANLDFILRENFHRPAYEQRMGIDSATYVGAGRMLATGSAPWDAPSVSHSILMQIWSGLVLRAAGIDNVGAIKLANYAFWLFSLAALGLIAWRQFRSPVWAAGALLLAASSLPFQRYCAVVQYELLAAALISLVFLLYDASRPNAARSGLLGAVIALLAAVRVHYILILPWLLLLTAARAGRSAAGPRILAITVGFGLLAVPFNLYFLPKSDLPFFFQKLFTFEKSLNSMSEGRNCPWPPLPAPPAAEPKGLSFIREEPDLYLRLLGQRAVFLGGFRRDEWTIDPIATRPLARALGLPAESARRALQALGILLAAAGIALAARRAIRDRGASDRAILPLGILAGILGAQLLIDSSTRFFVPLVPWIALYHAIALRSLGAGLLRPLRLLKRFLKRQEASRLSSPDLETAT